MTRLAPSLVLPPLVQDSVSHVLAHICPVFDVSTPTLLLRWPQKENAIKDRCRPSGQVTIPTSSRHSYYAPVAIASITYFQIDQVAACSRYTSKTCVQRHVT